jgi:hypothetical protein
MLTNTQIDGCLELHFYLGITQTSTLKTDELALQRLSELAWHMEPAIVVKTRSGQPLKSEQVERAKSQRISTTGSYLPWHFVSHF